VAIVEVEPVIEQLGADFVLDSASGDQEVRISVAIDVEERRSDIIGFRSSRPRLFFR
jgi:hypothetical protein